MNTKIMDALNKQVELEFNASSKYLDIAIKLDSSGYEGAAKFFFEQSEEERLHAQTIIDYLLERDAKLEFNQTHSVSNQKSITLFDAFGVALDSEKFVTKSIIDLAKLSNEEDDYLTSEFLNFFLAEQREEEKTMKTILDKLKIIDGDKAGLYQLDNDLASGLFRNEKVTK